MSEHSFILPDIPNDIANPVLPRSKAFHIAYYPQHREDFYDIIKDCAVYIDKLKTVEDKIIYTNQLSRIFIVRHKGEAMKLFRKLVNLHMKGR
jgi:hypothetical protein